MEIKSYFKMSLKGKDGKPSIKEVDYVGADGATYKGLQFEGYASTVDMDRTNDVVIPEAFKKSINQYMENPIIFLQHNSALPIGSVIEAVIDEKGLWIKGIVKADKENIFQDLRTGVIKTMSFGYRVNKYEQKEKKEGNKQTYYNEIQELELFEISLVSVPMNPKAKIKSKDELLGKNLSDEEYAKYFQTTKEDEYPLFKSIADVMIKFKDAKKVSKVGDDCEDEDGNKGTMEDDGDGNIVCVIKEKKNEDKLSIKTIDDLKQKTFELVSSMKTLDFECDVKKLTIPEEYASKIPEGAIYFEGIVSDESVNRYGEKVLNSAFKNQISKFIKTGIILNGHNSDDPIGIPLWVKINDKQQVEVGGYVFDEYMDGKVSKGLYRGLSIGFIVEDNIWENIETGEQITNEQFDKMFDDVETRDQFITLIHSYMFVITKIDWLEYSFVTTPANKGTTIKLDYIKSDKECIKQYVEKMQLDPVVEVPAPAPKQEEVETPTEVVEEVVEEIENEEKPEEVETPSAEVEETIETPAEIVEETVETPEITPENDGGEPINEEKPAEVTPENDVPTVEETPLEAKVDEIEKSFTKSLNEISEKFKNVEGLDVIVKEFKESMVTSIKELKSELQSEQKQFQDEVAQVVEGCVDVVNSLAKNFKNFCIDSGLNFAEKTETEDERKTKKLLETPLAKTISEIKS